MAAVVDRNPTLTVRPASPMRTVKLLHVFTRPIPLSWDSLPALEQVAIQHAVGKLEAAGVRLPAPHCVPVKGVDGSWWELRPRRGNCPWRPIYTLIGADEFKIAAIAPDGETNPREFMRACLDAAERLAKWKENEGR